MLTRAELVTPEKSHLSRLSLAFLTLLAMKSLLECIGINIVIPDFLMSATFAASVENPRAKIGIFGLLSLISLATSKALRFRSLKPTSRTLQCEARICPQRLRLLLPTAPTTSISGSWERMSVNDNRKISQSSSIKTRIFW